MIAMGIIAVGILLFMAILGAIGFVIWTFALLAFFRIFPREPSKVVRMMGGIYFAFFGAVMSYSP